ncbi:hypothetical protein BDV36DRAFT_308761 [Aspergillus pseudocaelatus]|uniref:Rhodopsin domain-containing protein n=1 Tax=Aspergillus pseudocaelatus TaxID=1825620 RepID=A0ABQ6WS65_9EURO|nr:hypothetical protein BDV36DRAFT_308761 [Aspergillus pseudocaelatus]
MFPATAQIAAELSTTVETLHIANACVQIAMGISLFLWQPIRSFIGRRNAYLVAILILFCFSIGAALAINASMFIAMRIIVGFTGTFLLVAGQEILTESFDPDRLNGGLPIWLGVMPVSMVIYGWSLDLERVLFAAGSIVVAFNGLNTYTAGAIISIIGGLGVFLVASLSEMTRLLTLTEMGGPSDLKKKAMNSQPSWLRDNVIAVNVLALVSIVLRFVARRIRKVVIGADDYLIIASLALLFTISGIALGMIHYGLGYNKVDLPVERSLMVAKLSILMMYRRIFTNISRLFRVGAMICGAVVTLWATAFVPAAIFQCTPVAKAWDIDIPGHCINLQLGFYCVALPNILTDIAILSLPIRSCWQLHKSVLYRLSLIGVFMLGIL